MLKKFFKLILGDLGLIIFSLALSVGAFFLFPAFLNLISQEGLYPILGWALALPFLIGFLLSSTLTSLKIFTSKALEQKPWRDKVFYLILSGAVLIFNIIILIINLI